MLASLVRRFIAPLLVGGLLLASQAWAELDRSRLREALRDAERAMTGSSARGDVIFLFQQGTRFTGRKLELFLSDDIFSFRELSPIESAEFELWRMKEMQLPGFPPDVALPADPGTRGAGFTIMSKDWELGWVVSIMTKSLSCKGQLPFAELVGDPFRGYVAAHQVLVGQIARARGCMSDADFTSVYPRYVSRLYSEMLAAQDERTDLHVERMAFMALIGRIDLVPPAMIQRLVDAQWIDGLWHYDAVQDHTTALAYVVISAAYGREKSLSSSN